MPVYVIDTLKPKNGLDFPVVEAVDVAVEGYLNLADAVTHFATDTAIAAINAALNGKADTSAITNLQSQIDQIAQAAGSGTADTEVAQARVDAEGVSHSTLKDRIDSCEVYAHNVQAELESLENGYNNKIIDSWTNNTYQVDDNTIILYPTSKALITPAFDISEGMTVSATVPQGYTISYVYLDAYPTFTRRGIASTSSFVVSAGFTKCFALIQKSDNTSLTPSEGVPVNTSLKNSYVSLLETTVSDLNAVESEISDAQVGADNHVYSSLKNRLDSEISYIYEDLHEFIEGNEIVSRSNEWINGAIQITDNTISISATSRSIVSDAISVEAGDSVNIELASGYTVLFDAVDTYPTFTSRSIFTTSFIVPSGMTKIIAQISGSSDVVNPSEGVPITIIKKSDLQTQVDAIESTTESNSETITEIDEILPKQIVYIKNQQFVKNEGKRYGYGTMQLIDDPAFCATSFQCDANTTYKLVGQRIGSGDNYAVNFLNSNGQRISAIRDQAIANELIVTTPDNCAEIRYTQYWSTAAAKALYGQYLQKEEYVDISEEIEEAFNTADNALSLTTRKPAGSLGKYIIGNSPQGDQTVRNGSDATFIEKEGVEYKLTFFPGDDELTEAVELRVQAFGNGYDNLPTYDRRYYHKFGHCNTVDYNPYNDCLIFGNGSGSYELLGKFYIIPNASSVFFSEDPDFIYTLENTNAIVYDCTEYDFGDKLNALWGEQNGFDNNLAYLITDDNANVRRIILGTGNNELPYGTIIPETADGEFNGTFDIIKLFTQGNCAYATCNQGSQFYRGRIICGIGHDGLHLWAMSLDETNNSIIVDDYYQRLYTNSGENKGVSTNGVCIDKNGKIIIGTTLQNEHTSTMAIIYTNPNI